MTKLEGVPTVQFWGNLSIKISNDGNIFNTMNKIVIHHKYVNNKREEKKGIYYIIMSKAMELENHH